jgi:hypothetical protein
MGPGRTEVAVLLREQLEGEFKAGATNEALRTHGLYDSFFEALDKALKDPPAAPTSGSKP